MQKAISKVRHQTSVVVILLTSIFTGLAVDSSSACAGDKRFSYDFFSKADVVFRGRVVQYQKLESKRAAQFQFKVIETLKGPSLKVWDVPWTYSTFGIPADWKGPTEVVLALETVIDSNGVPSIQVLQDGCTGPSIIEDTPENVRAVVRAAFK